MPQQDAAWPILLSAATMAETLEDAGRACAFGITPGGALEPCRENGAAPALAWRPELGWVSLLPADDPRAALLDLYLPICSATARQPITIGHLGQSIDGFIATPTGDSQFVTGEANILHLHRIRALSDAVVVGAGTVAADDPQLTTRLVTGPNALRVVFDPTRRLAADHRLFNDNAAPTLYICARSRAAADETSIGCATLATFDDEASESDLAQVIRLLRERGCRRVFIEGGGVTVSAFLEANLLDRLHVAVAPLLIGEGRPAIRLEPHASLRDCLRPNYRVFRMGGDILFDCDLRRPAQVGEPERPAVARVV
jgi:riboflavin-specific deaminase-like protein